MSDKQRGGGLIVGTSGAVPILCDGSSTVPRAVADAAKKWMKERVSHAAIEPQKREAMKMERSYEKGVHVKYFDARGKPHDALVTNWWGGAPQLVQDVGHVDGVGLVESPEYLSSEPACNVVFASSDPQKKDSYGAQIERETSVVHRSRQAAPGCFWCWPDELT